MTLFMEMLFTRVVIHVNVECTHSSPQRFIDCKEEERNSTTGKPGRQSLQAGFVMNNQNNETSVITRHLIDCRENLALLLEGSFQMQS